MEKEKTPDFAADKEISAAMEAVRAEAMKNAINAFNEGFLLGVRHAKTILEKEES